MSKLKNTLLYQHNFNIETINTYYTPLTIILQIIIYKIKRKTNLCTIISQDIDRIKPILDIIE